MFYDRRDAGIRLAQSLKEYKDKNAIVLALPRGGVVVADEVASFLNLSLSILILRKIGAPGNPELAIGAVAGEGQTILNQDLIRALGVSEAYLQQEIQNQIEEIERRQKAYLGEKEPPDVENKTVIIVDDGIATGSTARAAIKTVKDNNPKEVILAVPVAPAETINILKNEANKVVVLQVPAIFYAVGQFYEIFEQTTDEEVKEILKKY